MATAQEIQCIFKYKRQNSVQDALDLFPMFPARVSQFAPFFMTVFPCELVITLKVYLNREKKKKKSLLLGWKHCLLD